MEVARLKIKATSYHQQDVKRGRITYNFTYKCYPNKLKYEDLVELINEDYEMYNTLNCHYCNKYIYIIPLVKYDSLQLTFDRIDNDLPHTKDNIILCCFLCNTIRSNNYSSKQFRANRG